MHKYIDSDAFLLKVQVESTEAMSADMQNDGYVAFCKGVLKIVEKSIDEMPTADVQEVKHARWIGTEGILVCSECGHRMKDTVVEPIGDGKFKSVKPYYCGKCGARMGGDNDA